MTPPHPPSFPPILFSLLRLCYHVAAQDSSNPSPPSTYVTPRSSTVVMIIVILTTTSFFIGLFFFFFLCQCRYSAGERHRANDAARSRSTRVERRGLDPAVLETFPSLVYSDVKEHKVGKGALECAVCMSELEDDDMLRLLPKCDHVFHLECIDRWLESHATCPVCRANLAVVDDASSSSSSSSPVSREPDQAIDSQQEEAASGIEVPEMENSTPFHWPLRSISAMAAVGRRMERLYSDGDRERFTLRLPDHIQREVLSGQLSQSSSLLGFSMEQSSRRGYRRDGEGTSGSRGRILKIRSDRWAFLSSFNWRSTGASDGGGDAEASTTTRLSRERSTKGKLFGPLDCLGADVTKSKDDEETLPLAKV